MKFSKVRLYLFVLIVLLIASSCGVDQIKYLNEEENEWLQNNKDSLSALFGYVAPPNVYYNDDGEYVGLLIDYMHEIEDHLGIKVRFKSFTTWDELMLYSKTGRNFMIVGAARTDEREKYLSFTNSFIQVPYVMIVRKNSQVRTMSDLIGKNICLVSNYAVNDYIEQYFPKLTSSCFDTDLNGLRSVSTGVNDAMIVNQMYASFIIEKEGIVNLKIVGESGYFNRLSVAVSVKDVKLHDIVDKTVDQISPSRKREIQQKWVFATSNSLSNSIIVTILLVVGVLLLFVILFWLWSVSLRAQVNKKTKEIKESESKYRSLIENSNDAIYLLYDRKFEMINKKFVAIFGYSFEELCGSNFDFINLVASESRSLIEKRMKRLQDNISNSDRYEFVGTTKDNQRLDLEVSVSYVKYKYGIAVQGIIRDLTDRKKELRELLHAKEKAEESDRLKSAFLANVSHEIRTPMNGILGFTDLLKNVSLTPDIQETYIEIIEKSGMRMLNTINDIIDISRLESGQVELIMDEMKLVEELNDLIEFFKPEVNLKGISISMHCDLEHTLVVCTDSEKVSAVLINLIKNAIKYTDHGNIDLECRKDGDFLLFTITDTGVGISANRHSAIFNRFDKADNGLRFIRQGSGLGLSISKAYVEMLGGQIWLKSSEGEGSIFYFTIPFYPVVKPEVFPS